MLFAEELVKMGLMSEAHKHNLNRNRVTLMKNVQCLPSIFEFLRQDYTLTEELQEQIQVTYCSLSMHAVLVTVWISRLKY